MSELVLQVGCFYLFASRFITKLGRGKGNHRSVWKTPTQKPFQLLSYNFWALLSPWWLIVLSVQHLFRSTSSSHCNTQQTASNPEQMEGAEMIPCLCLSFCFVWVFFFFDISNLLKTASVWASVTAADDKNRLDLVKISESQCKCSKVNYCMHTCTCLPLPNLLWHLFSAGKKPVEDEAY